MDEQEKVKFFVQKSKDKVRERTRTGFLQDDDVLRLLAIKEQIYPIFDYSKLIQKTISAHSDVDTSAMNLTAKGFKESLVRNQHRMKQQGTVISKRDITNELHLPSIQGFLKKIKTDEENDLINEKEYQLNLKSRSIRPVHRERLLQDSKLEQAAGRPRAEPARGGHLHIGTLSSKNQEYITKLRQRNEVLKTDYETAFTTMSRSSLPEANAFATRLAPQGSVASIHELVSGSSRVILPAPSTHNLSSAAKRTQAPPPHRDRLGFLQRQPHLRTEISVAKGIFGGRSRSVVKEPGRRLLNF